FLIGVAHGCYEWRKLTWWYPPIYRPPDRMSIIEKQKETTALIVSKPPLHRRVEMYLLYDGFFSFAFIQ
ncbi:hypothetical protein, partial [Mediterraneibacter gnavus]|uniref:hypothetical protein n=1 Tax=Mediterraneibacter gnavus TaxID=33038 RepID=UPI001D04E383